jgi:hypothetical protein
MASKKRMPPSAVISMLLDCYNEAEANGFEVAQSNASIGEPCDWYDADECMPVVEWHNTREIMFKMPDGSRVRLRASRVAAFTQQGA